MNLKDWMYSMKEQFGDFEFKVTYQNEKGKAVIASPKWRDDPPNLKEVKASDLVLPKFLRQVKVDKKKLVRQITKYKENT